MFLRDVLQNPLVLRVGYETKARRKRHAARKNGIAYSPCIYA